MPSINDILKERQEVKTHSERAELIKFFIENVLDKNGKQYRPQFMAIKMSHLSLSDLYYFKSVMNDIIKRNGVVSGNKYFWWALRAK